MTKTHLLSVIAIITALLVSPLTTNLVIFADDEGKDKLTKLQRECQKDPKKPRDIKPECELLDIINSLKADQETKNAQIDALIAQLQEKDLELVNKDNQLTEKDNQLTDTDEAIKKRVNVNSRLAGAVCDNVPFLRDGLSLISQATSAIISSIVAIGDFEINFMVPIPTFATPSIIPTVDYHTKKVDPCDTFDSDIANFDCEFTYVSSLSFGTKSITLDVPDPSVNLGKPFSLIVDTLQSTNVLPAADTAITNITNCDPDGLADIDIPL